jgi:hypothetical protein
MLVTKHNLPDSERNRSFVVTNPVGKKRSFDKLMDLAQWAAANALGKPESEWLMNGRDVDNSIWCQYRNRSKGLSLSD